MKRITFFVGPNGCGKTRALATAAKSKIDMREKAIAIVNTPFVRLPRSRQMFEVFRVSPAGINKVVARNLKDFFGADEGKNSQLSELLELLGFYPTIQLDIKLNEDDYFSLDRISANKFEIESLQSALESWRFKSRVRLELTDTFDSFEKSLRQRSRVVLKHISHLKKIGIISSYELMFHHKKREPQAFKELSSGEQTLISTYLFIKSNQLGLRTIFIDEPENSLHPEWQRRYIKMLHMALGYSQTRIMLATHSPVLVSGALSDYGSEVRILRVNGDEKHDVKMNAEAGLDSVEEILWEAFETLTPVSHFLSIELSRILQNLTEGVLSQDEAEEEIKEFHKRSYNETQKKLLQTVLDRLSEFAPDA